MKPLYDSGCDYLLWQQFAYDRYGNTSTIMQSIHTAYVDNGVFIVGKYDAAV